MLPFPIICGYSKNIFQVPANKEQAGKKCYLNKWVLLTKERMYGHGFFIKGILIISIAHRII